MPSKSAKQHRLMVAAAHDASFAKKVGVPQKVAREFAAADAGKKKSSAAMTKLGKRPK
jgi:hypothetical protein